MAKTEFKSVDDYIASQPAAVRGVLQRVRTTIRKAAPDADEGISYRIPAYTVRRRPLLYFAGWKQHYSLYPATGYVVAALNDELAPYEISKGTIRFPLSQPVPARLIARIVKLRAKELAGSGNVTAAIPKQRRPVTRSRK
jgi:uncharacterized protein YdhG (YjbR/CyaY superfamily)